jgi:hypothetical protein
VVSERLSLGSGEILVKRGAEMNRAELAKWPLTGLTCRAGEI